MDKSVRTAKDVVQVLSDAGVDPHSTQYAQLLKGRWKAHPNRVQALDYLRRHGIDGQLLRSIDARLQETDGAWPNIDGMATCKTS